MHLSHVPSIILLPTTVMVDAMPPYGDREETGRYDLQLSNTQPPIVNAHQETMNGVTEDIQLRRQAKLVSYSPNQYTTHTTHVETRHGRSWLETVMMRQAPRGEKQSC